MPDVYMCTSHKINTVKDSIVALSRSSSRRLSASQHYNYIVAIYFADFIIDIYIVQHIAKTLCLCHDLIWPNVL